jgi:hypothetical protein
MKKMKKIYLFTLLLSVVFSFSSNAQVVISQVYGGGGNSGATFTNDFIEIFNRGTVAQDLTGWSVQYASATGTSWAVTALTSVTLQPGQYYLIQEAAGATPSTALPTPDATGTLAMSGSNGKVLLANVVTAQTGLIPTGTQVQDLVGFGATPTGFEGTGPTGTALTSATSAQRASAGCIDTNNNATDFIAALPVPRNIATPISVCSSAPSMLVSSPTNGTIYNPLTTSVTVNVAVFNFTVANATGTGHIHYSLDGGANVMKYDTTPIVLNGLSVGDHTVSLSLVDNNHAQLNPAVTATVTFTIAGFTDVATIAELRAGTLNAYYQLTGAAVVSHVRIPTTTVLVATTRNQKFIQDQTGGILIDDSAAKITTTFVEGSAMSNIIGQLVPYNGILEFVPLQDQPVVSQNNSIVPETVSLTDFNANVNNYECELLQFNNITIDGTVTSAGVWTALASGAVFTTATSYRVTDGTVTSILRTGFNEADYIGTAVPTTGFNAVALGYDNVNTTTSVSTPQFIVRKLADFSTSMNTQNNEIAGLKVYPNPVSNGVLHIESNANTLKSIALFDVLGKQVLATSTENSTINVSNLKGGIYILKITEAGKTAVSKLVIK